MKKSEIKYSNKKGGAIPYFLLSLVLGAILLVFMNI